MAWAMDFRVDVTIVGWPIKIVSIVDAYTRECLGGTVKRRLTGEHLIGEIRRLATGGDTLPLVPPRDKGDEFACALCYPPAGGLGMTAARPRTSPCTHRHGVQHRRRDRLADIGIPLSTPLTVGATSLRR